METFGRLALLAVALALILSGCSFTREPIRPRDEFFSPVRVVPHRAQSTITSTDVDQLKVQLESATRAAMTLRDSLSSLGQFAGSLLTSTRTLVERITQLETKEFLTSSKQRDLEQSIASLQMENKQLSQQVTELRTRLIAGTLPAETSVYAPARSLNTLQNEYNEGLSLFQQKDYDEAKATFDRLLDHGIEEGLADNCEYWKGECHYAKKEYHEAVGTFQRVLAITTSNKKADAYFMLGRTYEQVGDLIKAQWAYEELMVHYPQNVHARAVQSKLNALKRALTPQHGTKNKKTTA
jgi:TolA-binding protein